MTTTATYHDNAHCACSVAMLKRGILRAIDGAGGSGRFKLRRDGKVICDATFRAVAELIVEDLAFEIESDEAENIELAITRSGTDAVKER